MHSNPQIADIEKKVGKLAKLTQVVEFDGDWYLELTSRGGFKVMVEYFSILGLFGISTMYRLDESAEEVYHTVDEVVARCKVLLQHHRPCNPGTVSPSAYMWAQQEMVRYPSTDPLHIEYQYVVKSYLSHNSIT